VAALQAASVATLDAESAQSSDLIGSSFGLRRYREALATAQRDLDTRASAVGEDPEQVALLSGLRMAVESHFARLDKAAAPTPRHPEHSRTLVLDGARRQIRRDIQSFANAMIATAGHRFDERVVAGRDVRHAAETRLGGDEFAILMERRTVAQELCDRMDDFRFAHEERRFRIGMSIGRVPVGSRWQTIAAIQQTDDTSCYAATRPGDLPRDVPGDHRDRRRHQHRRRHRVHRPGARAGPQGGAGRLRRRRRVVRRPQHAARGLAQDRRPVRARPRRRPARRGRGALLRRRGPGDGADDGGRVRRQARRAGTPAGDGRRLRAGLPAARASADRGTDRAHRGGAGARGSARRGRLWPQRDNTGAGAAAIG
jgi:GGDEF domain-containing protein